MRHDHNHVLTSEPWLRAHVIYAHVLRTHDIYAQAMSSTACDKNEKAEDVPRGLNGQEGWDNSLHHHRDRGDALRHKGDALRHKGDARRHKGDARHHKGDALHHKGDALRHKGDNSVILLGKRSRRFSSIEPRSPTSPHTPNGNDNIYSLPDDEDNVFADEKEVPKSPSNFVPPPPTPGTAPSLEFNKKSWGTRKLLVRHVVLILFGVVLVVGLAVGITLAVILVNTSESTSISTKSTDEAIQFYGHLTLSTPWINSLMELNVCFTSDFELIINSSELYRSFIKSSFIKLSPNKTILYFTIDFKGNLLEKITDEVSEILLAKTVQDIIQTQVVKHAENITLSIVAGTIVILDNIPVTLPATVIITSSTSTVSTNSASMQSSSSLTTVSTTTEITGQCLPMTFEPCHSLLGSPNFYLPNYYHHTIGQQAEDWYRKLSGPPLQLNCSDSSILFLCSLLFPPCTNVISAFMQPCDTLCEVVKDECDTLIGWPQDCTTFPKINCIAPVIKTSTPSTTVATTTPKTTTAPTMMTTTEPTTAAATSTTLVTTWTSVTSTKAVSTTTESSTTPFPIPVCEPVEDFPICNDLGFHRTPLPSEVFMCSDVECLKQEFEAFANQSLTSKCTDDLSFFCGYVFPFCDKHNNPIHPCQENCYDTLHKCQDHFPYVPDCSSFLNETQDPIVCIPSLTSPTIPPPLPGSCVPLSYDYCASEGLAVTYSQTIIYSSLEEGIMNFKDWALPTIESGCSPVVKQFYCSLYFPKCEEGKPATYPCSTFCEMVNTQCPDSVYLFDCSVLKNDSSCVRPPSTTTLSVVKTTTPPAYACQPLNFTFCSGFGYSLTTFPNMWRGISAEEAFKSYNKLVEPAVASGCSENILFYACSILFPYCESDGNVKLPCRSICEEINKNCSLFLAPQDCDEIDHCWMPPPKKVCQDDEFTCVNINNCVPKSALCNQRNECGDWSDERQCKCDPDFEWQCKMGMCIPSYQKCDDDIQCPDNSDEICLDDCKKNQFKCTKDGRCIMPEWLCDGQNDCDDGADENGCDACSENEWACVNRQCIPLSDRCDGIYQCKDHSDETACISKGSGDGPFFVLTSADLYTGVCAAGFNQTYGERACIKLGEQSLKNWKAIQYDYKELFQLDQDGNTPSVLGRGRIVLSCPEGNIVSIDCIPKECGHPKQNAPDSIIKGRDSDPGAWPWMASMQEFGVHICGGAIIHPYFILTAAHCVDSYTAFDDLKIVTGTTKLTQLAPSFKEYMVRRAIIYPTYRKLSGDDIALLELRQPIVYNDFTLPLCYPEKDDVFTKANRCFIAGWGHTLNNPKPSDILQFTKLTLYGNDKCNGSYMWNGQMAATEGCAGYFNGDIAACSGDSGSPIVCEDETGTYKSVGIASYVYKSCNVATKPMAYTITQLYIDWIKNNTVCHFKCDNGLCLFDKNMLCDTVDDCGDNSDEIRLCDVNFNCSFTDRFLCGYKKANIYWKLVSRGGESLVNRFPLYDHSVGKYPGSFLLALSRDKDFLTPLANLTQPHCLRFHFHMRGKVDYGMSVFQTIPINKNVWEIQEYNAPDMWLMGMFDVPPGLSQFLFRPYDNYKVAIDDMLLIEGTCDKMKCLDGEFMCVTYNYKNCLPMAVMCNFVVDCDDESDEMDCQAPLYKCDFENGNNCGLQQQTNDTTISEWMMVNSSMTPLNIQDHTFGNASGTVLHLNTQPMLAKDVVVMSQKLLLEPVEHCLKFFFASTSPATLTINFRKASGPITILKFSDRQTMSWTPTQVTLPAGNIMEVVTLLYEVNGGELGSGTVKKAILLDDITISRGKCPAFVCPVGTLLCEGEAYCVPQAKVCDRVLDCNSGTDEISCTCTAAEFKCPTGACIPKTETCNNNKDCPDESDEGVICDNKRSVSCDFEDAYMCGYKMNTSVLSYHWTRTNERSYYAVTGPETDHTYATSSNATTGFYLLARNQLHGTSTSLSSIPFTSYGKGLVFYYHAFYEYRVDDFSGRLSLNVINTTTGDQRELWSGEPNNEKEWKFECITLPEGNISISFVAQQGTRIKADIGLDDIILLHTSCDNYLTESRLRSFSSDVAMESNVSRECLATEKPCRNAMCLKAELFCNEVRDCPDGSDEFEC
ncbi:unnamed protein product [Lymnaea stagnalis]|uniref:CORIN n=1 Tax=Lymnaea stagnalis TaxID=6523 RepID=A0AAV2IIB2_LYMST